MVELGQSWQVVNHPWQELLKLVLLITFSLAVGLLPYVDNWSHLGGFVFGILASMVFLPYITFGKWDNRRKKLLLLIGLGGLVALYVLTFTLIYTEQYLDCRY